MPLRRRFKMRRSIRRPYALRKRRATFRRRSTRRVKRGRAVNTNRLTIRNFPGITWPSMLRTKLQYVDYVGITSGITLAYQMYRGNSLHDPDFTGAGHRPRGLDQLAGLYERYYVGASKIIIRCIVNSTNANAILAVRAFNSLSVPTEVVIDQVMEARGCTYIFIQQQSNSKVMARYATTAGVMGESRASVKNDKDEWGAPVTANPGAVNSWSWALHMQNADLSTSTNCRIWVKIVYYCVFYGRKNPPQSI